MSEITPEQRSEMMRKVRSKNTKPELVVRSWLHRNGYRFRLHASYLPGTPDIVLPKYKSVILVHGCFWHAHGCKPMPKSNLDYWSKKIAANLERDRRAIASLKEMGWRVLVVWECDIKGKRLAERIDSFL